MYILQPDEEARIDAAWKRIEAGEWVEHEEMRKETKEWLVQLEENVKSDSSLWLCASV